MLRKNLIITFTLLTFNLFILLCINGCSNYKEYKKKKILVKVVYNDLENNTHPPSKIYVLFNDTLLNSFKLNKYEFSDVPSIAYHLTANGGIPVTEYINTVGALGCCDYGDMEIGYRLNYQEKLSKNELNKYEFMENITMDSLTDNNFSKLNFKYLSEEYEISIWEVDIDYCQCDFSFGGFEHRVYKNTTAIIKSMKNIDRPNPKVIKKIEAIINKIIYN